MSSTLARKVQGYRDIFLGFAGVHFQVLPIQVKNSVLICKDFRWNLVLLVQSPTNAFTYSGPGRMSKLLAQVSQRHAIPLREVYRQDKTAFLSLRVCYLVHPEQWDSNGDQYWSQHKISQESQVGHFTCPLWSDTSFSVLVTGVLHPHGRAHVVSEGQNCMAVHGRRCSSKQLAHL